MTERQNTIDRFMKFVSPEPNSGCWLWVGATRGEGRGSFFVDRKQMAAHRAAHLIFKAAPEGLCVCHSCDVPLCVNPDHLWLGTIRDNMTDCSKKGRLSAQKNTHCKNGHTYSSICLNPKTGRLFRKCAACARTFRRTFRIANRDLINAKKRMERRALADWYRKREKAEAKP